MATTDTDLKLYFRRKRTPPPSVLLLAVPYDSSNRTEQLADSPFIELRSRQQIKQPTTQRLNGVHTNNNNNNNNYDNYESSSYSWQRHSDKLSQILPAPDIVYRNTYMEESKREKSVSSRNDHRSRLSPTRSPSPQQQQQQQLSIPPNRLKTASSSSYNTSDSSPRKSYQQYRTVYDYIRESIKQIERQRNSKQQNFSTRVKRPQNEDVVLKRILGEKRLSATSKKSSLSTNELQSPQSLVNYLNHSRDQIRVVHTTTPNRLYPSQSQQQQQQQSQHNQKSYRQRNNLTLNQNDSLDRQRTIMMTATIGNS